MNPRKGDGDQLEPTDPVAVIGGSLVVAQGHERQATISRAIERLGGDVLISGLFRSSIQDPMTTPTLGPQTVPGATFRRTRHDNHIHQDRRTRPE